MGLDAHLYSTTPRRRQQLETERQRRKEYKEWVGALYNSEEYKGFKNLSLPECADYDKLPEEVTNLIAKFMAELKKKAESLGGWASSDCLFHLSVPKEERDPIDKLCYFDRNWDLHNFIAENFGDPKNDNLVEIFLDEAAITKILEKFPYPEFRTALSVVKGGGEVFYVAWY